MTAQLEYARDAAEQLRGLGLGSAHVVGTARPFVKLAPTDAERVATLLQAAAERQLFVKVRLRIGTEGFGGLLDSLLEGGATVLPPEEPDVLLVLVPAVSP